MRCQCVQGQRCTQPLFTYVGLIYGSGRFTLCPFVTCSVSDSSGFVSLLSLSSWLIPTGTQTLWSLLPKRHCLWPFQCKRNPCPPYTQTIFTQNWIGLDLTGAAERTLNFSFSFFFKFWKSFGRPLCISKLSNFRLKSCFGSETKGLEYAALKGAVILIVSTHKQYLIWDLR